MARSRDANTGRHDPFSEKLISRTKHYNTAHGAQEGMKDSIIVEEPGLLLKEQV